jgi:hypothetical protein
MNEFLDSLKADLLDRRMLPLLGVLGAALLAALGYAVLGGGSSSAPSSSASTGPAASVPAGIAVSPAPAPQAVAETTNGGSTQHKGLIHNPFAPLPGVVKAATASVSTSTAVSSASASSKNRGSATPSSGAAPSASANGGPASSAPTPAPVKPSAPAKPKTVYHVSILFGTLPAGTTPQTAQLTPFENLKLLAPLPSAKSPLIVYRGVTAGGKAATFTLVGEAILHGNATCLPSASQCQTIDLQVGKSEQLEAYGANGEVTVYELRIVSIAASSASAASVKHAMAYESKAGRELLRHAGLLSLPYMHESTQVGVFVFGHPAFAAHAARRAEEG